jgi:excisionase family DNA binding protein
MDQLFTVPEAAQQLRVSKPTVYRLIRDGDLRSFKIGGRLRRVPASAIEEFVARQCGVQQ